MGEQGKLHFSTPPPPPPPRSKPQPCYSRVVLTLTKCFTFLFRDSVPSFGFLCVLEEKVCPGS